MVLGKITALAAVDAVNPCTLAVQTILLGALLITKGKREAFIGGILFSLTIFVMYFLYGLGILKILLHPVVHKVIEILLKLLLIFMAAIEINAYFSYKPGIASMEMPLSWRPLAKKALNSVENPLFSIPVAALCSVLLLPCSSGPYVAALMILANYGITKIFYLLYYNIIFILPMIFITLLVSFGISPKKVQEWRDKHIRELHLISGILLLAVLFMLG